MYHYVRPTAVGLPHFPYLSLTSFERQLDDFASGYGFVSRDAFVRWVEGGPVPLGVLLTFDDGLRDHVDFVLPALRARNLFALFYVSSGPALTGRILDVHKVHLALGRMGAEVALAWLQSRAPELLPSDEARERSAYHRQRSDDTTKLLKHVFNWQLAPETREAVLDDLLDRAFAGSPPAWYEIYLNESDLSELSRVGMGVGAHGHLHGVPRLLTPEQQRQEVDVSCRFVEAIAGTRRWGYCYPHGVHEALTAESERAVADSECPFAFAVEARDIDMPIAQAGRYMLPRHNCNAFRHGAASFGE